ncbi:NAD-dependent protein deacylase Sirt4-like [Uloborus diversus]|uniref:NAD-dependent protein deacylase Sirt4-like n=1 Tax=Uloborus diversus TaxID=327109 RepID=UPI00240A54D3|nr:NAD-dependent protein deacylase Sirt4-like [Uloborus diversus]
MRFTIRISNKNTVCRYFSQFSFVPNHEPTSNEDVFQLQKFVDDHKKLFILTGAGISTESGLPDYRSKDVGLYDRSPNRPVQYQAFISSHKIRQRYWARNFVGWKRFSSIEPNNVHTCLANWENKGRISCLITQNVDRLHHKAGSVNIIELHGTSYVVKCLKCNNHFSRFLFQSQLEELNPEFRVEATEIRPDADVDLEPSFTEKFKFPDCGKCGGILKPDVVFFGENVPKKKVNEIYDKLTESDAMLVLGSSLEVFSGYRFALAAVEQKKCLGIVNIGPNRAEKIASFKLNVRCGDILPKIKL